MDATEPSQAEAPLVEALRAYRERRTAAFHTPGHKLGAGAPADLVDALGERLLSADMGIANGLDDTQESGGLLGRAEELAAQAWGAERSFFVTNGSSGGLQALVMAGAGPGDEIIVPRNAHKSLLTGLILSGSMPVYVEPTVDATWQVPVNVPLDVYVAAIERHPRARAVVVTSPSCNGFCADVPGLAALARARIAAISGITVLGRAEASRPGSVDFDPVRLTISAAAAGLTGYELERRLRADHAVAVEAANPHNVVANITIGDSEATIDRLVAALGTIAATARARAVAGSDGSGKRAAIAAAPKLPLFARLTCSPREAFFGASETVPLAACVGRVSAGMVVPYPPGIPVLGPGEEISAETVAFLQDVAAGGVSVHGPADPSLATLRVVVRSR